MSRRLVSAAGIAALFFCGGYLKVGSASPVESGVVASVYDGDTLTLRGGRRVRLVQIDSRSSAPRSATRGQRGRRFSRSRR